MKTAINRKKTVDIFILLPILAASVDLLTPYLIWQEILPSWVRWGSHSAVALMIVVSVFRMSGFNRFPISIWLILAVSVLWAYIAVGHGQGITPTIWGIWLLFQFPFVSVFMYLQPELPQRLPEHLRVFFLLIIGVELIVQLLQFSSGVPPGDDLAGLFGENGTGNAVLFEIFVCCVFLGHWIASKKSTGLFIVLSMCMLSSVLGEMKLFSMATTIIGLMAICLYTIKYRAPGKMLIYLIVILIILISFISLYNSIVPGADETPIQTYITDPSRTLDYLFFADRYNKEGGVYTNLGRGYAVQLGWTSLQKDTLTLLFGYGIGTRSESQTLGTSGVVLTGGELSVGTSLLIMMQETGLIGLIVLTGLWLWIVLSLVRDIRAFPESPTIGLRYALCLFSVLWPLWLWYANTWIERAPMLFYWFSIGYVFAESRLARCQPQSQAHRIIVTGG